METREEDAIKPIEYKLGFQVSKQLEEDSTYKIMGKVTKALRESFENLARESYESILEEWECTFDLDEDDFVA